MVNPFFKGLKNILLLVSVVFFLFFFFFFFFCWYLLIGEPCMPRISNAKHTESYEVSLVTINRKLSMTPVDYEII